MCALAIQIPQIEGEQEIEVEVKINGVKRHYNYRIEIFAWDDCPYPTDNRVECIKQLVSNYDSEWELAHIGMPTDDHIPITFRKKNNPNPIFNK